MILEHIFTTKKRLDLGMYNFEMLQKKLIKELLAVQKSIFIIRIYMNKHFCLQNLS